MDERMSMDERSAEAVGPTGMLSFDCPRCGASAEAPYWGPCPACREDLAARLGGEAREIEVAAYEPKMNVVPNQVATKD
jgi:hypothetical protein